MAEQPTMDTIPNSFIALQSGFLPAKTANVNRTIQFDFTGAEAGSWNIVVQNGTYAYHQGPAENPNATVTVDSTDWLKILRGETNPVTAFMGGKIKVTPASAAMDLMQFQNWFAR
ncbi:MAG TPA: SCP2 sterol-binding domain-containing protein [Ktedonobacterales bacterium]|nr:SCP2 sterol-binding domain-containing protein [Ktedonobacterales bacterium]